MALQFSPLLLFTLLCPPFLAASTSCDASRPQFEVSAGVCEAMDCTSRKGTALSDPGANYADEEESSVLSLVQVATRQFDSSRLRLQEQIASSRERNGLASYESEVELDLKSFASGGPPSWLTWMPAGIGHNASLSLAQSFSLRLLGLLLLFMLPALVIGCWTVCGGGPPLGLVPRAATRGWRSDSEPTGTVRVRGYSGARGTSGEVHTFVEGLGTLRWTVSLVAVCHFIMQYNCSIIGGVILYITEDPQFAPLGSAEVGALVSCMLLGAAIGAGSAWLSDYSGRRAAIMSALTFYLVGGMLMVSAENIMVLLLGRTIAGLGVGLSSVQVNVYITELSPAEVRSELSTRAPVFGTSGILFAFLSSILFGLLPGGAWRLQLGMSLVPASIVMLLSAHLPETPRWLLTQNRREQAEASLRQLFPDVAAETIEDELELLSRTLTPDEKVTSPRDEQRSVLEFLQQNRRALIIGIALNVAQQIVGINVVMYYGPTVLTLAGFSKTGALIVNLCVSAVQVCCVYKTGEMFDSMGRRFMSISGVAGILVGIACLGLGFLGFSMVSGHHSGLVFLPVTLAVLGVFIFRMSFSFSLAALPFVVTAEIFPQESRAIGVSIAKVHNWMANFLVSQSFPMLRVYLTAYVGDSSIATASIFGLYFVITSVVFVFLIILLPETGGIRLEQVKA